MGFGPGERQFSGSIAVGPVSIGSSGGEGIGRFMFGTMGLLVAIGALLVWRRVFRRRDDDRDA